MRILELATAIATDHRISTEAVTQLSKSAYLIHLQMMQGVEKREQEKGGFF